MEATVLDAPLQVVPFTAPSEETICAFVREVKSTIERVGWTQLRMGDYGMGFCILGAINIVAQRHPTHMSRMAHLLKVRLADRIGTGDLSVENTIARWNDSPGRTKEQVINLLDEMTDCRS